MTRIELRGVHHVQLAIPEAGEERGRAFYGGVLGLTEVAKPAPLLHRGGCWFRGRGVEIHLGIDRDFRPARKAHVAMLVADLDETRSRLSAQGVEISEDDFEIGFRRFYSDDPFGNRLEFVAADGPG